MSEVKKNVYIAKVPSPEYDQDYWKIEPTFEWMDSNFLVEGPNGPQEAGTVLLMRNKIEFLHHLTDDQLVQLKQSVTEAVDHELSKR